MLSEEYLFNLSQPLVDMFAQLENDAIITIAGRIGRVGEASITDTYRLAELSRIGRDIEDIEIQIAKTIGKSQTEVRRLLNEAAVNEYNSNKYIFDELGKTWVPFTENAQAKTLVNGMINTINANIADMAGLSASLSGTTSLGVINAKGEFTKYAQGYQEAIDYAILQVRTGQEDFHGAMRQTIRNLSDGGLSYVEYESGYVRRLDSSVRNAFMGGQQRLSQQIAEIQGKAFGADGMEISWHSGARPSHVEFAGQQYSMDDYNKIAVPLLSDYNCYHRAFPIVLGISTPTYTKKELAELNANDAIERIFEGKKYNAYEAQQMQRRLETAIRREKDRAIAFKAAGDLDAELMAKAKVTALNQKYAQFSKAMDITTNPKRVAVAGYTRGKTVKFSQMDKALKERIDKLNDPGILMTSEKEIKKGLADFARHAENMDEPYKNIYKYYAANTDLVKDKYSYAVYSYDPKKDALIYNPRLAKLSSYQHNANIVYSHELAHRYDLLVIKSWENKKFTDAINSASEKISKNIAHYNKMYSSSGPTNMAFQDILSALSKSKINVQYGHKDMYWNEQTIPVEIFANLSYLKANKVSFPEFGGLLDGIIKEYEKMFGGLI